MPQEHKGENAKYRATIKKYRKYFELTQGDLSSLLNIEETRYNGIESGRRVLDIDTADEIAAVYGLRYFEMGQDGQSIPEIEHLPKTTQNVILERKKSGIKPKNTERNLGFYLDKLIKEKKLNLPVTAKEVWMELPKETKENSTSTEITSMLTKKPRNKMIAKVGKRGKEHLFQLKKVAEKE